MRLKASVAGAAPVTEYVCRFWHLYSLKELRNRADCSMRKMFTMMASTLSTIQLQVGLAVEVRMCCIL